MQTFDGYVQTKFVIIPCFAGPHEDLVLMGSENGKITVWSKLQGTRIGELAAHEGPVNGVFVHPKLSNIIASVGDDSTLRVWNLLP